METHGVFLRLRGRRCVVVGDDEAALGRALACAEAGAAVELIGASASTVLGRSGRHGSVRPVPRPYRAGDLAGAFLAYASVRDPDVIRCLRDEARREGVLLNVIDVPDACDFFAGATVARGPVTVLVGTGGTAPAVAGFVRELIEAHLGREVGDLASIVAAVRDELRGRPDRGTTLRRLARSRLVDHLRAGDVAGAERVIQEITGVPHRLAPGRASGAS